MADFTTTIVTRFEVEADQQNAELAEVSKKMEALGRKIEKSTDGFDKLRSAVDATGDRLRIFGVRGRKIADAIEDNIEDPVERARMAMKLFREETNRTPTKLDKLNGMLGRSKARWEIFNARLGLAGPLLLGAGAAALGAATAIGVKLVDAIKAYIAVTPKAKADSDRLSKSMSRLEETVGGVAFRTLDLGDAMQGAAHIIDGPMAHAVRSLERDLSRLNTTLKGIPQGLLIGLLGGGGLQLLGQIGEAERKRSAAAKRRAEGAVRGNLARAFAGGATGTSGLVRGSTVRRGGGGGGRRRPVEQPGSRTISLADRIRQDDAALAAQAGRRQDGISAIAAQSDLATYGAQMDEIREKNRRLLTETAGGVGKVRTEVAAAQAPMLTLMQTLASGAELARDQFVGLGGAIGSALGTLVVGKSTIGDFGKSMLGVLGSIATQWGTFFLTAGSGFAFLPGGQGASPGMIAAGIGLTALGAGISALSSGSSGRTASRGASGTAAADVARDIVRPRDDEPRETTIQVFVAGDQIREPIWKVVREGVRTGHLQTQGAF